MQKMFARVYKDQEGTIIMLTILILGGMLIVALAISSIAMAQTKMASEQHRSTKAYFAAEAGAERIVYEIRKQAFRPRYVCTELVDSHQRGYIGFDNNNPLTSEINKSTDSGLEGCDITSGDDNEEQVFNNNSSYTILYDYNPTTKETVLTVSGSYLLTNRILDISY